jgi:hypothetical protein
MCNACVLEARNTANQNARATSGRLQGHGRSAHGADAGRRRQNAAENRTDNINAAWQHIYDQTLARLQRRPHPL